MKTNYFFMCFILIIIIIPQSIYARPLTVTQERDEYHKRCFGICESNIKVISTNINKAGSLDNAGLVYQGNFEITGKPVIFLPVHQTSREIITTTGSEERTNDSKTTSNQSYFVGTKIHFLGALLLGGLIGAIISVAIIWLFFLFTQRQT